MEYKEYEINMVVFDKFFVDIVTRQEIRKGGYEELHISSRTPVIPKPIFPIHSIKIILNDKLSAEHYNQIECNAFDYVPTEFPNVSIRSAELCLSKKKEIKCVVTIDDFSVKPSRTLRVQMDCYRKKESSSECRAMTISDSLDDFKTNLYCVALNRYYFINDMDSQIEISDDGKRITFKGRIVEENNG